TEFEKEKNRALVAIDRQKESPRSIIQSYFDFLIYGNHVYGNIPQGTAASLQTLETSDLKTFYNANYAPNGAALSVVGDFSTKEMKALITKLFSEWKKSANAKDNLASKSIPQLSRSKVLLVNRDDAKESTFYIGSQGI